MLCVLSVSVCVVVWGVAVLGRLVVPAVLFLYFYVNIDKQAKDEAVCHMAESSSIGGMESRA